MGVVFFSLWGKILHKRHTVANKNISNFSNIIYILLGHIDAQQLTKFALHIGLYDKDFHFLILQPTLRNAFRHTLAE